MQSFPHCPLRASAIQNPLTDLNVAFKRNVKGRTFLHTLQRPASSADSPLVNTEFQQITFADMSTPAGPFSAPLSIHWGSNFDYTTPDETAPGVTITTPAADASLQLKSITGTAADPGLEPSGVAIVWVKLQRLSDGRYWNPGGGSASEKWTTSPVLLPTSLRVVGSDLVWSHATDLPSAADAPANAQYRVSAFAIEIGLQLDFDETGSGAVAGTVTAQNGSSLSLFASSRGRCLGLERWAAARYSCPGAAKTAPMCKTARETKKVPRAAIPDFAGGLNIE